MGLLAAALLPAVILPERLPAQEAPSANTESPAQGDQAVLPDWDINSLFNEPPQEAAPSAETKTNTTTDKTASADKTTSADNAVASVAKLLKKKGFTFGASYEFAAGVAPGWYEVPWSKDSTGDYYFDRVIKMRSTLSLDAQITDAFRTYSALYFEIPNFSINLGDFYFDYSLYDKVFIRGGKYNLSWGISPNYNFTNLLVRVPEGSTAGDSFILKADIPVGIGGFQVLALTRADLMHGTTVRKRDIAYGGKYNLALRLADLDIGVFNQEGMPLRGFLSFKTTLGKTDLYSEGLCAIDVNQPSGISGAASLGASRDFFNGNFSANAELFYNGEKNAFWYTPETTLRDAQITPFIGGLNAALNLLYRFGGKANPRIFIQARCAPLQNTAQLIPGFRLNPWSNIELYLAVPMALGSETGYYFKNTITTDSFQNRPLPFSVMLLLTLRGAVKQ